MKASSSRKQLNIRSDEAHELAQNLARRFNRSTTAIVVEALRDYSKRSVDLGERLPDATIEANRRLLDEARQKLWGGDKPPSDVLSNHDWLYDDNGLPK